MNVTEKKKKDETKVSLQEAGCTQVLTLSHMSFSGAKSIPLC